MRSYPVSPKLVTLKAFSVILGKEILDQLQDALNTANVIEEFPYPHKHGGG